MIYQLIVKNTPGPVKRLGKQILALPPVKKLTLHIGKLRLSPIEKKFVEHNKKIWKPYINNEPTSEVIIDTFMVPDALISYSYFANVLAKKNNATIKSFLCNNTFIPPKFDLFYKSFNVKKTIMVRPNRSQKKVIKNYYKKIKSGLKTKQDVFDIEIEGCHIGLDIYESYLRDFNKYTLNFDSNLDYIIKSAITLFVFWNDYFKSKKIAAYLASHEQYIWINIVCRVAYKYNIPVYYPNSRGVVYATKPFSVYSHFHDYPIIFKAISVEDQEKGLKIAESNLQKRFSGALGVNNYHSTASSFGEKSKIRVLKESQKVKVLIATHCFYDNPHAYQRIPFLDFYEWLIFVGNVSKETDYEWYIKVHPDPLPGTEEIIEDLIKKFPHWKLINYSVSHHQIIEEGIDCVLTVHGTIGEEYPYFDVPVINAGYNPRIAYDFNYHAKNKEDYRNLILKIPQLKKEYNKKSIYEFYFVNHYLNWVDDIIFDSYKDLLSQLNGKELMSEELYEYFLNQFSDAQHEKKVESIDNFINSKKRRLLSFGPF
ncbi:hypothetical protein OAK75_00140 [Bacteriovoracales bacterium]|nr:hypothetical protein [Bacteriovoracales bacterium]